MKEAWDNVETLLNQMKPLLLMAGIPERQIRMPLGREPNDIRTDQFVKAFDWLHNFKLSPEWLGLEKAYALCKPATWEHYKIHRITGLREQGILESATLKVRKLWKVNRPSFFGRIYKQVEQEDGNQETA